MLMVVLRTAPTVPPPADPAGSRPQPAMSLSRPTSRRPSWILTGGLLVGLAALVSAYVFGSVTSTVSVMVAASDLDAGRPISRADLRVVEMGRVGGIRAIQPSDQDLIVGRAPRGPIPAGTVLNTDLFVDRSTVIPSGMAVVGAALGPGAAPSPALSAGDPVQVLGTVRVTGGDPQHHAAAEVLATGVVWSVEHPQSAASSGRLWVSILIPVEAQTTVAQAAADDRLRLSLVGEEP
jgi:Flp pilus assembly protein CpaB